MLVQLLTAQLRPSRSFTCCTTLTGLNCPRKRLEPPATTSLGTCACLSHDNWTQPQHQHLFGAPDTQQVKAEERATLFLACKLLESTQHWEMKQTLPDPLAFSYKMLFTWFRKSFVVFFFSPKPSYFQKD